MRRARRQAMGPGGDWPGRRARARQLRLGGRAPPLRLPPGAQPRGRESGHPRCAAGGSGCCVRSRHRAHPGCGDPCLTPDAALELAVGLQALGRGPRAPAHCSVGPGGRRESKEGGGNGRGRDESPRGEGAAAQPLPQRPGRRRGTGLSGGSPTSAHPRSGLGHSDFARLFWMEGPFPLLLLLPRKVISRHPRGLRGQFGGPVSFPNYGGQPYRVHEEMGLGHPWDLLLTSEIPRTGGH